MKSREDDDEDDLRNVIVFRLEQLEGADSGPLRSRLDRLGAERVKEMSQRRTGPRADPRRAEGAGARRVFDTTAPP